MLAVAVGLVSVSSALLCPAAAPSRPALLPRADRAGLCTMVEVETPPKLESAVGFDYVPLLTALQSGEFREADHLTRDALIKLAGKQAIDRGYVYFTEVSKIANEDMATVERLWQAYSGGKFGYSLQRQAFKSKKVGGDFDKLFGRLGWKNDEGKLLRWLPEAKQDEFIYDLEKAPRGHLPLTSTLRGTQLLNNLMMHPAWDTEEFSDVKW